MLSAERHLARRGRQEEEEEKPPLWENERVSALSTQSGRFHSGSWLLIIRAHYVQAKSERVPKFKSLCATATMRVLCASP